jgi:hypothetical protein
MGNRKFVKGLIYVVPQWPEFLSCPVAVYLWGFDINVLKSMCGQIEFLGNGCCSECEVVAVANVDSGATVLFARSSASDIRTGFN